MKELRVVTCKAFDDSGLVAHGMSMGGDPRWNMSFKFGEPATVHKAREEFGRLTGIPAERIVKANQVHGRDIIPVGEPDAGKNGVEGCHAGDGDALITSEPNLPIAILIADCVPVFLFDPVTPAIGIAHAGWRGTDKRIAPATVAALKREYGTDPGNLIAWIGPSIGKKSFRVSPELFEQFRVRFPDAEDAFDTDNLSIDLKAINRCQLIKALIDPVNVHVSEHCTAESRQFFSYRRDGKGCGHMIAALMLKSAGSRKSFVENQAKEQKSARKQPSRKDCAA